VRVVNVSEVCAGDVPLQSIRIVAVQVSSLTHTRTLNIHTSHPSLTAASSLPKSITTQPARIVVRILNGREIYTCSHHTQRGRARTSMRVTHKHDTSPPP
jgi:hypothetical protein